MQQFFEYSSEVKDALQNNKPVLALESTIITHGMPFPQNIETANIVEEIVRHHNVVPATIALMKGKIKIGLSASELQQLGEEESVIKASRRDIPYALSQQLTAGTTVAGTLFCAHHAGIKVFATGGIGGVHRGTEQDISADLIELARTPLAVVCAGAKAILDLPRTLEFLETFSIPLIGYQTNQLPAFYTSKTPYPVQVRLDNVSDLAKLLTTHWQLGMTSGAIIANPIPQENEIAAHIIEPVIAAALKKAEHQHIVGKAVTPFLLSEVTKVTQGESLKANIQLIKNNALLGGKLAAALNS